MYGVTAVVGKTEVSYCPEGIVINPQEGSSEAGIGYFIPVENCYCFTEMLFLGWITHHAVVRVDVAVDGEINTILVDFFNQLGMSFEGYGG